MSKLEPGKVLVLSFLSLILVGFLLLMLPISHHGEMAPMDALFTSTSAVCVTGLVVKDTSQDFTAFGQVVLLFLLQLGGLGIMTFTAAIATAFKKKMSRIGRLVIQDSLANEPLEDVWPLLKTMLVYTCAIELVGALALYSRFSRDFSHGKAAWHAVFHSVSAFCNAGFSTFRSSLMNYQDDLLVNGVVGALIVCGGLGFFVVMEMTDVLRRRKRPRQLSLHSKLVLSTSLVLLLWGVAGFWVLEWNNTLEGAGAGQQALTSLFQSITARTAGFNTVDMNSLRGVTLFFMLSLMFIGASPGSTGGGVKTTTFGLLYFLIRAKSKGEDSVHGFNRRFPPYTIQKAMGLLLVGLATVGFFTLLLSITESNALPFHKEPVPIIALLFEVVSALGTVGLSTGITPDLTFTGKWLISLLMFTGRVGPITLLLVFALNQQGGKYQFAEEPVMIG